MHAELSPELTSIAAHGLDRGAEPAAPPLRLDRAAWAALAPRVTRQRLTGLTAAAVECGALELDPWDLADLAARDRRAQRITVRAERTMLQVSAGLAAAGIEHRVLKGSAVAHTWYSDPAQRPFVDVDLLVRGEQLDDAVRWCQAQGCHRQIPELRPGFDRRFAKSVTLLHPDGVEIDLHRTLALGPLAQVIVIDDLWAPARVVDVTGVDLPALQPPQAFLHACTHTVATPGAPRLLSVRDVAMISAAVDLPVVEELARRWRATGVVAAAIAVVHDLGIPVPEGVQEWAAGLSPTRVEERVLRAYQRRSPSPAALAWDELPFVPGVRAKVAFAVAWAVPSTENRRYRRRTLRHHGGRVVRQLTSRSTWKR